jgi:hypothetical protein
MGQNRVGFQGDALKKGRFMSFVTWHQEQDRLRRGTYGGYYKPPHSEEADSGEVSVWCGCAVACAFRSMLAAEVVAENPQALRCLTPDRILDAAPVGPLFGNHAELAKALGVPDILVYAQDNLFEWCAKPDNEPSVRNSAYSWPFRFGECIEPGADLNAVWAKFCLTILRDP